MNRRAGTRARRRVVGLAIAAAVVASCESSHAPATPTVTCDGALERGAAIVCALASSTSPASLEVLAGTAAVRADTLVPTAAGALRVRISNGSVQFDTTLTIAAPPTIVFQQSVSGNSEIVAMALDGADVRIIAPHPANDLTPTSAAGRVVWASTRGGTVALYTAPVPPVGGTASATLLSGTTGAEQPALSPDNRRLAWRVILGGLAQIITADANGAGAARFAPANAAGQFWDEAAPQWAPDGALWFVSGRTAGVPMLWRGVPGGADGSATQVIPTPLDSVRLQPAVSPDGRRLAFTTDRLGGSGGPALALADAPSGANVTQVVPGWRRAQFPRWIDDRRVLFQGREVRAPGDTVTQLLVFDRLRPGRVRPVPGTLFATYPAVVR